MVQTRFIYSGYYDAPLAFVAWHEGAQYLFWRGFFDEELDDYPRTYQIYELPDLPEDEIQSSWAVLPERATAVLGSVALDAVVFDPTKRQWVDSAVFAGLKKVREK